MFGAESQPRLSDRGEDPQRGSALISGLVTPPRGGGGSGDGGILVKEDRDLGRDSDVVERALTWHLGGLGPV